MNLMSTSAGAITHIIYNNNEAYKVFPKRARNQPTGSKSDRGEE